MFSFKFRISKWVARMAVAVGAIASASVAYAQGCAMCYNTAAAAKASAIQALRQGILILLIPPVVILGAISWAIYNRRNKYREDEPWGPEQEREFREMVAQMVREENQGPEVGRQESEVRS